MNTGDRVGPAERSVARSVADRASKTRLFSRPIGGVAFGTVLGLTAAAAFPAIAAAPSTALLVDAGVTGGQKRLFGCDRATASLRDRLDNTGATVTLLSAPTSGAIRDALLHAATAGGVETVLVCGYGIEKNGEIFVAGSDTAADADLGLGAVSARAFTRVLAGSGGIIVLDLHPTAATPALAASAAGALGGALDAWAHDPGLPGHKVGAIERDPAAAAMTDRLVAARDLSAAGLADAATAPPEAAPPAASPANPPVPPKPSSGASSGTSSGAVPPNPAAVTGTTASTRTAAAPAAPAATSASTPPASPPATTPPATPAPAPPVPATPPAPAPVAAARPPVAAPTAVAPVPPVHTAPRTAAPFATVAASPPAAARPPAHRDMAAAHPASPRPIGHPSIVVRRMQVSLLARGLYGGSVTGVSNPGTVAGVRHFQAMIGHHPTGVLTSDELKLLTGG